MPPCHYVTIKDEPKDKSKDESKDEPKNKSKDDWSNFTENT